MIVTKTSQGYLVNDMYMIGEGSSDYLTFALQRGEDMSYDSHIHTLNYPGEYEISGKFITILGDSVGKLSFVCDDGTTKRGCIQAHQFAGNNMFSGCTYVLAFDDRVIQELKKVDDEREIIDLRSLDSDAHEDISINNGDSMIDGHILDETSDNNDQKADE